MHNNYSFLGLYESSDKNTVELEFEKIITNDHWGTTPYRFSLIFKNVTSVYFADHDANYPSKFLLDDNKTIDLFGFSDDSDEIMNGPADYLNRQDFTSLLFVFVTGKAIKITSATVELHSG